MELDPITLEVISNRLREIGLTMEYLLFHSGYSTILRESQDGSAGVCDREGRVSIASGGVLNIYPHYFTIQAILQSYPLDKMREGDSFVLTGTETSLNIAEQLEFAQAWWCRLVHL